MMTLGRKLKTSAQVNQSRGLPKNQTATEEQLASDVKQGVMTKVQSLQHNYGNQATGKILNAIQEKKSPEASKGVKAPYEKLVKWLEVEANQDQQQVLWRQFETLSPAQRQAVLLDMAGSMKRLELLMNAPVNWGQMLASMVAVDGVEMQLDEPETEGNVNETGVKASTRTVDVAGLLTPYKEIMLWLNYKANKQGKAELMQRFGMLSIPQKKIALHKMVNLRKLIFTSFSEAMTVTILFKKWVDWDKMLTTLNEVEKIKLEASDEKAVERYLDNEVGLKQEEQELEDDGDLFALGFGILGLGADEEEDSEIDIRAMLDDPEQLNWLLLGIKGLTNDKQKAGTVSVVGTPDLIVDRFLQLDEKLPPKVRQVARKRKLMKYGFQSSRQCYVHLLTIMVSLLFERGVTKKEEAFIQLIEKLGLSARKPTPTEDMIAHKLGSSQ